MDLSRLRKNLARSLQTKTPTHLQDTLGISCFTSKKGNNDSDSLQLLPTKFTFDEVDIVLPHKLLAQCSIRQQGQLIPQLLIQWKNKPVEEATWEEELLFKNKFPNFSLEDKTLMDGTSSDREEPKEGVGDKTHGKAKHTQPIWLVYYIRKIGDTWRKERGPTVKPGKNLIFLKNGKNSKIAEMVQGSLEIFLDLG